MEAKLEKKAMEGKFKTWKMRCWRIKDRRLIHYNSTCSEWDQCINSKIKLDIDLALLSFASFYPKSNPKPNLLQIKHPKIGNMLLRFGNNKQEQDTMASWLKVLTSWGVNRKKNRIYVAIPSNFSFAIWNVLNVLYDHPDLLKTEGIFRKESTNIRIKHELCNNLLYEKISIQELKNKYNDIHLLAKSLQYLLLNLPSSLFGDHEFNELLQEIKSINIDVIDDKKINTLNDTELDNDVANISYDDLNKLKAIITNMYIGQNVGNKYQHRYGLIGLILHLIKQITMNVKVNRMTCHSMARLFAMCFESKQYIQNMMDPFRALLLIKMLIYHSYFLFPQKQWKMSQIVVAEKQEAITMEKYQELQLSKKQKKNRLKKMVKAPPTKYFDQHYRINNIKNFKIPSYKNLEKKEDDIDEISPFKKKQQEKLKKLNRYKSSDDLDIGGLEKKEYDTTIRIKGGNNTKHKHFEAIHTKTHKRKRSNSSQQNLSKHISFNPEDDDIEKAANYKRERSLSVPSMMSIQQIELPQITKTKGWTSIHQTKIDSFCGEPCYFEGDDKYNQYIYFIVNSFSKNRECWKYNIYNNEYKSFIQYPENLNLINYTVSIDKNSERLFIIGGNMQFIEIRNINNNKEEIETYCDDEYGLITMGNDPTSIFIGYDIGELHIIGGKLSNYHLRWDEYNERMITLNKFNQFTGIQGHHLLYINNEWNKSFQSKLLLLGGYTKFVTQNKYIYCDHILCCDINEASNQCSWSAINTSLPSRSAYFGAVIYKNIFIIIFGGRGKGNKKLNDIWYLNINTMKWTHSNIKCPIKGRGYYAILTNNNMIHLFQRDSVKHFTIKIKNIISDKELNEQENEQEIKYKKAKQKTQKKATLEIEKQKAIEIIKKKSSSIGSIQSIDSDKLLSPQKKKDKSYDEYDFSSSTSLSRTPTPKQYNPNQYEIEKALQHDIYSPFKPNINTNTEKVPIFSDDDIEYKADNNNNNDNYGINHEITRSEIEDDRFSCQVMYDWFASLCGLQPQPITDRVQSDSYHHINT